MSNNAMKIISQAISDKGMVRPRNEDSFFRDDDLTLYVVADGMGGHRGGDVASRLAVEEIERAVREWTPGDVNEITGVNGPLPEVESKMTMALKQANSRIWNDAAANPDHRGMGTTSTAAFIEDGEVTIAHVGDSRAYLIRDSQMRQVTEDHSWVNEQVKAGFITNEEARTHRLKNLITRSLGHEPSVKVDVLRLILMEGDRFVLCSDGLTNLVTDEEIADVLLSSVAPEALKKLVDLANERGGNDNITAVVIEVHPG